MVDVFNVKFGEDGEKFLKEVEMKTEDAYKKSKVHVENGKNEKSQYFVLERSIRLFTYHGEYSRDDGNDYTPSNA